MTLVYLVSDEKQQQDEKRQEEKPVQKVYTQQQVTFVNGKKKIIPKVQIIQPESPVRPSKPEP